MPTGRVIFVLVEINIFAQKKSFQVAINKTIASAPKTGLLSGKIILKNILKVPAPSILADSSNSLGIERKNCLHKNIPSGDIIGGKKSAA